MLTQEDAPALSSVQNKMHYAVHDHTAAELIVERADSSKTNMGQLYPPNYEIKLFHILFWVKTR